MTLLLIEGFESVQATKVTAKGWSVNPGSLQTGRFGGSAARYVGLTTKTLPASATTFVVGFAFRLTGLPASPADLCSLGPTGGTQPRLQVTNAGLLRVATGSTPTVIATGTTPVALNTWYYVEWKVVLAGASGSTEVRLNGVSEIAATTGNFGTTAISQFGLGGGVTTDFDDVYVLDTTGAAPRNDFLGDIRVVTLFPSADGANSAWTPNSGTAHFSRVNEAATTFPDDDTSYVSDATPGHTDTYAFDNLPAGATAVRAVQVNMYVRKDDAGTRTIAPVVRQSGTDTPGTTQAVPSSYAYLSQLYQQDPTSTDWTVANVNADEFGVREIA